MTEKKYLATACLLAIVVASTIGCSKDDDSKKNQKIKDYKVTELKALPSAVDNEYPATLQGIQNVEIRARVDGFIESIKVDEGASVRKGQLLFTIDDKPFRAALNSAVANVKLAEAAVDAAKLQIERVKHLTDKNIVSNYDLKQAMIDLNSKEAALAQAKAAETTAKINLGYTRITSPTDGVIGLLPYKTGALVGSSSAQALTTVSNIGKVYAYFSMNEKDFLGITREHGIDAVKKALNDLPEVTLVLADKSEFPLKGKIETVNGLIDTKTGSAAFRAVFNNKSGAVRSGNSAVIKIPVNLDSAILIPQKAAFELQDKRFVFAVDSESKVKTVEITVYPIDNGIYYTVTSGLKPGDVIVTEGINGLKDGMKIQPVSVPFESISSSWIKK